MTWIMAPPSGGWMKKRLGALGGSGSAQQCSAIRPRVLGPLAAARHGRGAGPSRRAAGSISLMQKVQLGRSDLHITPICLGTMTFGEQVGEAPAHAVLDRALERGVDFIDTAEMYAVPARRETFGATETIIGNWFEKNPGARQKIVLATKVAGPSRGMPWVREGSGMTAGDIAAACEDSLKRR